jgi:hypothetical protein
MRLSRAQDPTADLFWAAGVQEPCRTPAQQKSAQPSAAVVSNPELSSPRYVLPGDLYVALQQLSDLELDRLVAATRHELQRRRRLMPSTPQSHAGGRIGADEHASEPSIATKASSEPRLSAELNVALKQGQVNAVRATFKAGIAPSRIARQFGINPMCARFWCPNFERLEDAGS